jgi:hypothetical protein
VNYPRTVRTRSARTVHRVTQARDGHPRRSEWQEVPVPCLSLRYRSVARRGRVPGSDGPPSGLGAWLLPFILV